MAGGVGCCVLVALATCTSALPVTNKAVAPDGSASPPTHAHATQFSSSQQFKGALLQALYSGSSKVKTLLASVGVTLGTKAAVHSEYDQMAAWWCAQKSRPADSTLCAKREFTAKIKGMTPEQKKVAMKSQLAQPASAVARKAMGDEAKQMIDAYCKTSGRGTMTTICSHTTSLLDAGKKKLSKMINVTGSG